MPSLAIVNMWAGSSTFDRVEGSRSDPAWVAGLWQDGASRVLAVDEDGRIACDAAGHALRWEPTGGAFEPETDFLLGVADRTAFFAVVRSDQGPFAGLRELTVHLDDQGRELATVAVALANWHRTASRCGTCGGATEVRAGGFLRHCGVCGKDRFPRTDPAVIVAVLDPHDRLLLGRQPVWPSGRMSLLAGFVSAGESLEQAVRREVGEEVGVDLDEVRYLASQPWPFPRSLMLGFVARARSTVVQPDGVEIEHARWFTPADLDLALDTGELTLPMSSSIAFRIIDGWRRGRLPAPEW